MTRLEALIEDFTKYRGWFSTGHQIALRYALGWADKHPRWISVDDELPEDYREVIIAISHHFCHTAFRCGDKWYSNDNRNNREFSSVTHWMPLPEPPVVRKYRTTSTKGGEQ